MQQSIESIIKNGLVWIPHEKKEDLSTMDNSSPFFKFISAGAVHEWFLNDTAKNLSYPPCTILSCLAGKLSNSRSILWIGRKIWPTPFILRKTISHFTKSCIFIDPEDEKTKLWATVSALRSSAVGVVISDLSRLKIGSSKRLSIAAKTGNTTGLLVRSIKEISSASAANTRWIVEPKPSSSYLPRWEISLVKSKGLHSLQTKWIIEAKKDNGIEETISLHIPSDVVSEHSSETFKDSEKIRAYAQ